MPNAAQITHLRSTSALDSLLGLAFRITEQIEDPNSAGAENPRGFLFIFFVYGFQYCLPALACVSCNKHAGFCEARRVGCVLGNL